MKIAAIKRLVESCDSEFLKQAEQDLYDEKPVSDLIEGEDEGEKLTHVLAALWIQEHMKNEGTGLPEAIRNYSQRVRNSISG